MVKHKCSGYLGVLGAPAGRRGAAASRALLPVDVVLERHRRVGQVHFVRIMGRVPGKLQQKLGRRFLPRPRRLCSWRTPGGVPVAVDLRLHERICPNAYFLLPSKRGGFGRPRNGVPFEAHFLPHNIFGLSVVKLRGAAAASTSPRRSSRPRSRRTSSKRRNSRAPRRCQILPPSPPRNV